jgi:catechol 2,3-dioxygenase-like lactoylglutathione lyase family enzyme
VHLGNVALLVEDYDSAIRFFVNALGFELIEDSPSLTNDGRPKRWVVVRPPGAGTGLLLARADGADQAAAVGNQFAGRVGFFLEVEDFAAAHSRMIAAGVEFVTEPRTEPYGRVAVFVDVAGNRWDLLGPARPGAAAGGEPGKDGAMAETFTVVLRGYDRFQVDQVLSDVDDGLASGSETAQAAARETLRTIRFSQVLRGYASDEVDREIQRRLQALQEV